MKTQETEERTYAWRGITRGADGIGPSSDTGWKEQNTVNDFVTKLKIKSVATGVNLKNQLMTW